MRPLVTGLFFLFTVFPMSKCLANTETGLSGIDLPTAIYEEQIDQEIDELKALIITQPDNQIAVAYLGHALTQKALFVPLSRKKNLAQRGIDKIDQAVRASPFDPRLRLIRAVNAYHLPKILKRHPIALKDFESLEVQLKQTPEKFSPALTRQTLFHLGSFSLKEGRKNAAIKFLTKAQKIPSDLPPNQVIQSLLHTAKRKTAH
jgi:tetratricopeptide (TPR) repeat protein